MTSFVVAPQIPSVISGLTIINGAKTATLMWVAPQTAYTVEIWASITNDINDAVLLGSTKANTFTPSGLNGVTYFWVRAVNSSGVQSGFSGPVNTTPQTIVESPTAGTAVSTPLIPTVSAYSTWYNVGTIEWTAAASDVITCTAYCTTSISNVVASGSDRVVMFVRSQLFNVTEGAEVWGGAQTQLVYDRHGSIDFGLLNNVHSESDTFVATSPGLLIPGDEYRWSFQVRKEQVVGTPTLDLTVIDASCFADAASVTD